MDVSAYISSLVQYGLDCALIEPCDTNFITNQLLQALGLDSFEHPKRIFFDRKVTAISENEQQLS